MGAWELGIQIGHIVLGEEVIANGHYFFIFDERLEFGVVKGSEGALELERENAKQQGLLYICEMTLHIGVGPTPCPPS